jgi:large conductance mechanosensitive channel
MHVLGVEPLIKGFRNFLLQGSVVVIAIGLMVALAFSTLIKAFTDAIINPLLNRFQGGGGIGLGIQLGDKGNPRTFLNIGAVLSAVIYFLVFMGVLYFLIVVPYKAMMARRGETVFGDPAPVKTCPACLSEDLPVAASKCRYCGSDQPATATA